MNTAKSYTIRWVLTHDPIALFEASARRFSELVENESDGQLRVNVYTPTEYGHGRRVPAHEVVQKVVDGALEMSQTYVTVLGKWVERLWVLDLPFLFESHEHAARVLDGPIGMELLSGLSAHQVKGLAFTYSGGYRILSTTDKIIQRLEDFRGLQVRTSDNPVVKSLFQRLGATPHPAPLQAIPNMTEAQVINAAESTWPRYWDMHHELAQPIVHETQHSLFLTAVMINQGFYARLPAHLQTIVRSAALRMARMERAKSIADADAASAQHQANGGHVVHLPHEEMLRLKHIAQDVYTEFAPVFGQDLIQRIQQGNVAPETTIMPNTATQSSTPTAQKQHAMA